MMHRVLTALLLIQPVPALAEEGCCTLRALDVEVRGGATDTPAPNGDHFPTDVGLLRAGLRLAVGADLEIIARATVTASLSSAAAGAIYGGVGGGAEVGLGVRIGEWRLAASLVGTGFAPLEPHPALGAWRLRALIAGGAEPWGWMHGWVGGRVGVIFQPNFGGRPARWAGTFALRVTALGSETDPSELAGWFQAELDGLLLAEESVGGGARLAFDHLAETALEVGSSNVFTVEPYLRVGSPTLWLEPAARLVAHGGAGTAGGMAWGVSLSARGSFENQ